MKFLGLTLFYVATALMLSQGLTGGWPILAGGTDKGTAYVTATEADFKKVLSAPPVPGSKVNQAEVQTMMALQAKRTPEQEKEIKAEDAALTMTVFAEIIGPDFAPQHFPKTNAMLEKLKQESGELSEEAKKIWERPRPFASHEQIQPCLRRSKSFSYPSGQATVAQVWARTLSLVFPQHRTALLQKGDRIALNRVIGGVHYPSDIAAGKKLGEWLFTQASKNPAFQADLAQVKQEGKK